jgi:hypothetical protein
MLFNRLIHRVATEVSALNYALALGILRGLSEFCGKEKNGIAAKERKARKNELTSNGLKSIQPQINADKAGALCLTAIPRNVSASFGCALMSA